VPAPPVPRGDDRPAAASRQDAAAEILLRDGIDALRNRLFPLSKRRTSIGRDRDCDVALDLAAVSRNHAALVWEGDRLFLIHESRNNPTRVNGALVEDRRELFDGDEIRIAEQVCFEVIFGRPTPASIERTAHDVEEEATRYESVAPAARSSAAAAVSAAKAVAKPVAKPVEDEADLEDGAEMRTVVRPAPVARDDEARTVVRAPTPAIDPSPAEDRTVIRPAPVDATVLAEPTGVQPAPADATVLAEPPPPPPPPVHATVVAEPTVVRPATAAATIVAEPAERAAEVAAGATMIIEGDAETDLAQVRSAADTLILDGPDDEDEGQPPA